MRIAGPQRQRRAKVVSQLGHLEITDCGDTLTDDGLSTVVLLRRLKSFEIAFCWNITGDGLIHLCSLANLQSLTVLYCGDRTDRILSSISRLSQLRNLDLCFMEADEAGFSQVATLHQLQSLEIDVSNIGDEGWSLIRNLEELRSFHAIGSLSDATMCYSMTKLHHLHTLAVTGAVLTDVGLGCLAASLLRLRHLSLVKCLTITNNGLSHLEGVRELETLDLSECVQLSDAGLFCVASRLRSLTLLSINAWSITEEAFAQIGTMRSLKHLSLASCAGVTDEGIRRVGRFEELEVLNLSDCANVTDAGLNSIAASYTTLLRLNISGCTRVTDKGITSLATLAHLRLLDARRTLINATGFHSSSPGVFPLLFHVYLEGCSNVTDAGIRAIAALPMIRRIRALSAKITAAGHAVIQEVSNR